MPISWQVKCPYLAFWLMIMNIGLKWSNAIIQRTGKLLLQNQTVNNHAALSLAPRPVDRVVYQPGCSSSSYKRISPYSRATPSSKKAVLESRSC
ncbi:hypothetical protein SAMN05421882_100641 [Nitrosomonas communis]|uniref:Uncharacterized protein n=1 Tax=Nitrosomonas communis TaxID=44574 RepID=A0A1H2S5L1_9PROT|nr:hypothetical protein SAMN05421882_100641 [Nitrosomonas communis]